MGILDFTGGGFGDDQRMSYGLLGLAGLASMFDQQGPRYTTNLAEATTPRQNTFAQSLPAQMIAIQKEQRQRQRDEMMNRLYQGQISEQERKNEARNNFISNLPPTMDPAQRAYAGVNPDKVYEFQYGWQKPPGQIEQERADAEWKSNLGIRQAQQGRVKTPEELKQEEDAARRASALAIAQGRALQVLSPEAEAQRLRMQQPQVKPQAVIDQEVEAERRRAAIAAEQAQKGRIMTPEELAQRLQLEREKALLGQEGKAPSEGERKASGFYDRMVAAEKVLKDAADSGYDGRGWGAGFANTMGAIPLTGGVIGNKFRGSENEKIRQAQLDWAGAKLRFESGATISDQEIAQEAQRYFPQPGEGDAVVAQKAEARARANEAMRKNAGRAAPAEPADNSKGLKPGDTVSMADVRYTALQNKVSEGEVIKRLKAIGVKIEGAP